jgi:predicted TIM-barrel enzyme
MPPDASAERDSPVFPGRGHFRNRPESASNRGAIGRQKFVANDPALRENPSMPNIWTGKGNPYTREEVVARLRATLRDGKAVIAAGAGTGISAKFIEKGGADLLIVYNSGRYRMMGHGSTAGLMAYGDANAVAMEIGEYEVLPVVEEIPVICGVHATDPRRRMWHWLGRVKEMGFSGVNNFPTHCIVDGQFRQTLEETGMSVQKEVEMIALARRMDLFTIVYVSTPEEARAMADAGADAIIAHVGCTVGGSIGVTGAAVTLEQAAAWTQRIIDGAKAGGRDDLIFLSHGGPILTPEDAEYINRHTDTVGFVGASSLERIAVEQSLPELTRRFKSIAVS